MKEVRMATLELTYCHDTVVLRCEMTMPAINMSNFFILLSAKFNFPNNLHDSGKFVYKTRYYVIRWKTGKIKQDL